MTRNSDGQQIGDPTTACTSWVTIPNPAGYTVAAGAQVSFDPATQTLNAFESWTEFRLDGGTTQVCEYHDPDGSNPSFCPGRDANGN